jgi:hypothetical protein
MTNTMLGLFSLGLGEIALRGIEINVSFPRSLLFILLAVPAVVLGIILLIIRMRRSANPQPPTAPPPMPGSKS